MSSTPTFPGSKNAAGDPMTKASDMANDAADRAKQMGREAVDRLDASRGSVAEGIHSTADALRSNMPDPIADKAKTAADAIDRAANYVRDRDLKTMASDLTSAVRQNPGASIIAAAAFGFLIGVALRRD